VREDVFSSGGMLPSDPAAPKSAAKRKENKIKYVNYKKGYKKNKFMPYKS